ncbi:fibronectin type III domain-containing protein [uncultured Eubacterium sp.]|uniref:fibronectin type III domain-containing protein n=1 Tax=uncultured Eubacterium sp. TaxID=165185 RepID=UPI00326323BA
MKRVKGFVSVILTIMVILLCLENNVKAGSYPSVYFFGDDAFENLIISDEAIVGEKVFIRMHWFAEFNYEGYDLVVYDSNGNAVLRDSNNFSNIDYTRKFTITWDTTGCQPGRYTVEVTKKFYSLYRWNEAPIKSNLYINLKDDNSTIETNNSNNETLSYNNLEKVKNLKLKNKKGKKIYIDFSGVTNAEKYKVQYSTDKKFKKNVKIKNIKYTWCYLKKLKKGKNYYIRVCALNENDTGDWSATKKIKIKK